jgi:riboflavin synthase
MRGAGLRGVACHRPAALPHCQPSRRRASAEALSCVRQTRTVTTLEVVFTGIVREVGTVSTFDGSRLVVETNTDAAIGDSVAIAGVCLTVTGRENGSLSFDVVAETLDRTTLGRLVAGSRVNVEPSLRAGDPLGGHIVQGHVDGVGSLRERADLTWFDAPAEITRYCVEKGSIAVDGTSLTVAATDDEGFAVALIPHTLEATTLGSLEPGDPVNLEVDVLAKYVEKLRA